MPEATVCKQFKFEAAHRLDNHSGKCQRLHGHSYRVDVMARGPIKERNGASDEGMVLDFAVLSTAWEPLHRMLDHRFLNDLFMFPTTAENLAEWMLEELHEQVPAVFSVRVWETASAYAQADLP